jgi:hypothetical protein
MCSAKVKPTIFHHDDLKPNVAGLVNGFSSSQRGVVAYYTVVAYHSSVQWLRGETTVTTSDGLQKCIIFRCHWPETGANVCSKTSLATTAVPDAKTISARRLAAGIGWTRPPDPACAMQRGLTITPQRYLAETRQDTASKATTDQESATGLKTFHLSEDPIC